MLKLRVMTKKIKSISINNSNQAWVIFGGASLITLYFNSKIQDPFNSPKMWLLFLVAAWLCGHIAVDIKKQFRNKKFLSFLVLSSVFIFAMLISAFLTDLRYTAFFGENQRRTGVLTYFSLAIVSIATSLYIRRENIVRLQNIAFFVLLTLVVYGQMQINGIDFVAWNNTYNAIITTVGNPNFAAAIMAVMATLVFGVVMQKETSAFYRIISAVLVVATFWTIYLSNARQGLLAGTLGIWLITTVKVYQKRKIYGQVLFTLGTVVGIFSILGMLQIGPLQGFLYKGSVTVRGYYWNAGLEMFKDHWFTGVGIDRYGEYFKSYRDVGYPLNYGFEITSTNAHNVPIQLLATGGILVGIFYILILIFTLMLGIKSIRKASGSNQLAICTVVAAWLAFQAQSIVSIDNIGISIWGWVLNGVIIGFSIGEDEYFGSKKIKNKFEIKLGQPLISGISTLLVFLLIIPLYQSESNMFKARALYNPQNQQYSSILKEFSNKILKSTFADPFYKLTTATYLIDSGYTQDGMRELEDLNAQDPRNLDVLMYLAVASENLGNLDEAIKYRKEIEKYDKWNARNLLSLGLIYKKSGDLINVNLVLEKIRSYASSDPIYTTALQELS